MLPEIHAKELVWRLGELSRVNVAEFARSPQLCGAYQRDFEAKRFKYVDDKLTCGLADCWSSYRALLERYPVSGGPILLDCEDAASAHAGWLAAQCFRLVWVGLVPGDSVSHAVAGVSDPARERGKVRVIDPCVWWGMGAFGRPYTPVYWERV